MGWGLRIEVVEGREDRKTAEYKAWPQDCGVDLRRVEKPSSVDLCLGPASLGLYGHHDYPGRSSVS